MEEFHLSWNSISSIPDDAFFGLTFYDANLYLINNPIRSISKHAFRGIIGRITHVYMSDCKLTEFPEEPLSVFPYLSIIQLQNNQLTEIPDGVFKTFLDLTAINLGGNTIKNINRDGFFSGVENVLVGLRYRQIIVLYGLLVINLFLQLYRKYYVFGWLMSK